MSYDPRTLGALCDQCYLRNKNEGGPVPPELNPEAKFVVVGEAPGNDECEAGRPFVGRSGAELDQSFLLNGVRRQGYSLLNTLCCQPIGNKLDHALHQWERESKKREKAGLVRFRSPMDCCRPRLLAELALANEAGKNVIAVGKRAVDVMIGKGGGSILRLRGGPVTLLDGTKVMPTLHPAFVLRQRRWTRAFRTDLGRAVRWFSGISGWREPRATYQPTPDQLWAFLNRHPAYAYDTETRSPIPGRPDLAKECLLALLSVIGFATDEEAMVVQLVSKDGQVRFYSQQKEALILDIIREWAVGPSLKIDWNGYYDYGILKWNLGVIIQNRLDGILVHRVVESEIPHGLGVVASIHTDIPGAWKLEHSSAAAETDAEWCRYNLLDCTMEFRATSNLLQSLTLRRQEGTFQQFQAIQRYCIGMHEQGLWANSFARDEWDVKLRRDAVGQLAMLRTLLSLPGCGLSASEAASFNPRSTPQLTDLFFDRWQLVPEEFSEKTGDPSTGDDAIRALMRDKSLSPPRQEFLKVLRQFRATTLMRGTFVRRMISYEKPVIKDSYAYDEVEEREHQEEALLNGEELPTGDTHGYILADGRIHPHWLPQSVVTGRLASNTPNAMNYPRKLRNIIAPHPGAGGVQLCATMPMYPKVNGKPTMADWLRTLCGSGWNQHDPIRVFIYADEDQLEMRLIACFAKITRLLEAFEGRQDPHSINGEAFFGDQFKRAVADKGLDEEHGKRFDRLRDFSKIAFYALCYNALFETFYDIITSTEDADGNLPFVHYTERQVRVIYDSYIKRTPEIAKWWEDELALASRQGYLAESVHGFRCDFLDGVHADEKTGRLDKRQQNKIINWRAQATGHALVADAAISLTEGPGAPLAFGRYGHGTGLIMDGHDRLDAELPTFHPRRWADPKKPWIGWCEPSCTCPLEQARQALTDAMTYTGSRRIPGLPVDFTARAQVVVGIWT